MTAILVLLGGLALWAIVACVVVVSRDGYRRQPTRPTASLARDTVDRAPVARPTDIVASQWLAEAGPAGPPPVRQQEHAAGAMVLRPW